MSQHTFQHSYCVAKAAVEMLTKSAALELAPRGTAHTSIRTCLYASPSIARRARRACMHACICMPMHCTSRMHARMHTCIHARTPRTHAPHVCTHVHMHARTHARTHAHIHSTHAHIHSTHAHMHSTACDGMFWLLLVDGTVVSARRHPVQCHRTSDCRNELPHERPNPHGR